MNNAAPNRERLRLLPELTAGLWQQSYSRQRVPILDWLTTSYDMAADASCHDRGMFDPYPYQVEPLRETENPETEEIDVMAGQRLGKSQIWKLWLSKRINDGGFFGMILYPSLELAEQTNRDSVVPILRTLDRAKRDLATRGNVKKNSFHLPSCSSTVYFAGRKPAISITLNAGVVDEADFHEYEEQDDEGKNTSNILNMRIRMKTHRPRMLIVCSSPTTYGGPIHGEWKTSSRGVWNMTCLGCGAPIPCNRLAYPMPDGTFRGLQWRKDDAANVIAESIRLICPACGRAHVFDEAAEMNRRGLYVHENPAQRVRRGFQVGALANPKLWTWREIAEAQEAATSPDGRKYLRNTVLGMPYKSVRAEDTGETPIPELLAAKRSPLPADLPARLSIVILGADSQATGKAGVKYWVWRVRGFDEDGNSWGLGIGTANTLDDLAAAGRAEYCGMRPLLRMVDDGGFDTSQDLRPFVQRERGWLLYKGEGAKDMKGERWKRSESVSSIILADALAYQVQLLDLLYGPVRQSGYRWNIEADVNPLYMEHLANVQKSTSYNLKDADSFSRWVARGRRDYFDCEKVILVALDVACHLISAPLWPRKNLPKFKRLELIDEIRRRAKK